MKSILENLTINKIKKLSSESQEQLCVEIRNFILYLSSKKEIHVGSNLGIVELTISLFKNFDFLDDKILYDTGHQTYVHKILTNRANELLHLKEENGPIGLINMNDSQYDHYSSGHSGNILSVISGLYKENSDKYYVAVIGDAALNNGLSFEGLSDISYNKLKIIIVVNDNQMSISKSNGALVEHLNKISKKNNFFTNLNFEYIGLVDGHNLNELDKAFKKSKKIVKNKPVIVHIKTIKGKGIVGAESDITGKYHSNVLTSKQTFGNIAYLNLLNKLKEDKNIKILNPAMNIGSGFNQMHLDKNPNYYDTGICESHTISKASGMALNGNKVFCLFYSTFLQRSYDQLIHDCSRLNLNLTILLDRSDIATNEGDSHHGIFDVPFLKSIPNVNISSPRNFNQLNQLIDYYYIKNKGINIIRYPTSVFVNDQINNDYIVNNNEFEKLICNGNKIAILTYGPYTDVIYKWILENKINVDLYNTIFINKINEQYVDKLLNKYKHIILYERIYGNNGLFSEINEIKNKFNLNVNLIPMNYKNFLGHGVINVIDKKNKMDLGAIKEIINQLKI